jgi:hypothetical protein
MSLIDILKMSKRFQDGERLYVLKIMNELGCYNRTARRWIAMFKDVYSTVSENTDLCGETIKNRKVS